MSVLCKRFHSGDHHVVEEYLKYWHLLAYGFCKIHVYIHLGSQKTPEIGRKVNCYEQKNTEIISLVH